MNSDKKLEIINNKVIEYFREVFNNDKNMLDRINKIDVVDNVESIITRLINYKKELDRLTDIDKQYKKDVSKAYIDAYTNVVKEIQDTLTKEKAIQMVSEMTISQIMETYNDKN